MQQGLKTRPEVRKCKVCGKQQRLRVVSLFENSHLPLLTWVRAIYLMMQGKRGLAALELQYQLGLSLKQPSDSFVKSAML